MRSHRLVVPALLLLCGWAAADSATDVAVLQSALAENQPYRNAVYLFLRLAGAVWIAVEWIAAFLLWRAWRLLAKAARDAEARP